MSPCSDRRVQVKRYWHWPLDLSKYQGKKISNADYTEITELAMKSITALVEELRGEKAPEKLFDPREHGLAEYGNFKRKKPQRQVGDS